MHQLGFGIAGGKSRELLEAPPLVGEELLELLLFLGDCFLLSSDRFGAFGGLALPLLEQIVLAVQLTFFVLDAPLFALDLFSPTAGFDFPLFAKLDQLFLARQDGGLAEAFRLSIRLAEDFLRRFFRGCLSCLLPPELDTFSALSPNNKKNRTGNNKQKYASYG
jgi:hypothetical protein